MLRNYLKFCSLAPEPGGCTLSPIYLSIFVLPIEKLIGNAEDEFMHGRYPQKEKGKLHYVIQE